MYQRYITVSEKKRVLRKIIKILIIIIAACKFVFFINY